MPQGRVLALLAALLAVGGLTQEGSAAPIPACVAGDIIAADPTCPASGPCTISQIFTVSDGCVLDFGTRDVSVSANGELRTGAGSVTLTAGSFTVDPGGIIDGTSTGVGGSVTIRTTGNIAVEKATKTGRILVSGKTRGGNISLEAGGDIRIEGQLHAHNRTMGDASGGDILLHAGGDVVTTSRSDIDPHGGQQSFGGFLSVVAGGFIDIGSMIDATGGRAAAST